MDKTQQQHAIGARDHFRVASIALAKAILELQDAGGFDGTIREIKETVGDLAATAEAINRAL